MSQKTRFIQFRVTSEQHSRIIQNARARGYLHLSTYLRELALVKDMLFERKINEMYKVIVKGKKSGEIITKRAAKICPTKNYDLKVLKEEST